jgi:Zn-dependent protease
VEITADHVRVALFYVAAFVVSTAVHEFGHAFVADRLGDRIPRLQGRLTLSPMAHIDPVGTLAIPLVAVLLPTIGFPLLAWGKPVQTNPANYTRRLSRTTAHMMVAAAGPFMNLVLAVFVSIVIVILGKAHLVSLDVMDGLFRYLVVLNIMLLFFNLIPLGPLDGASVLAGLLPPSMQRLNDLNRRYGMLVLLVLFFAHAMPFVMKPVGILASAWAQAIRGMVPA